MLQLEFGVGTKFGLAQKSQLGLTLEEMSNRRQSSSAECEAKQKDILASKIRNRPK